MCFCTPAYIHYVLMYDCAYDTVCAHVPSRLCAHTCECTCYVNLCVCVCVVISYCEGEQYTGWAWRPFGPHIIHLSLTGSQRPIGPFHCSGSSLGTAIGVRDKQARGRLAGFRGFAFLLLTFSCFPHLFF